MGDYHAFCMRGCLALGVVHASAWRFELCNTQTTCSGSTSDWTVNAYVATPRNLVMNATWTYGSGFGNPGPQAKLMTVSADTMDAVCAEARKSAVPFACRVPRSLSVPILIQATLVFLSGAYTVWGFVRLMCGTSVWISNSRAKHLARDDTQLQPGHGGSFEMTT